MYKIDKAGLEIVHGCQLKCIGCPNSHRDIKVRFVDKDDYARMLANIDVKIINIFRPFNFGEPLLHPDVPGLLELIPQQDYRVDCVEISTNAQISNFKMLEEVFKTGVLHNLAVSCDGNGTPEEYEKNRPPAKWERLIEFLTKAKEYRDRHAPHVNLFTRTICETEEGKRRWAETLDKLGWGYHFRNWMLLPDTERNKGQYRHTNEPCRYLQDYNLYVDIDGTVVPCCQHPRAAVLGNLMEEKFSAIFKGAKKKQFISALSERRSEMKVCGNCDQKAFSFRRRMSLKRKLIRYWIREQLGISHEGKR